MSWTSEALYISLLVSKSLDRTTFLHLVVYPLHPSGSKRSGPPVHGSTAAPSGRLARTRQLWAMLECRWTHILGMSILDRLVQALSVSRS